MSSSPAIGRASALLASALLCPLASAQSLPAKPVTGTAPAARLPDGSPTWPQRQPGSSPAAAPALQAGGLSVNEGGATYRHSENYERLQVRLGARSGAGAQLGVDYARLLSDRWALGANATLGAGPTHELVLNGLYSLPSNLHIGASVGWLRSTDTYQFRSGADDVAVQQWSGLLRARQRFDGDGLLAHLGAKLYVARALRPDVDDAVITEETPTLLRFLIDPRAISPGRLQGLALDLGLRPWRDAEFTLGLGRERLVHRYLDGSATTDSRVSTSLDYRHALPGCWRVDAGVSGGVASRRWRLGVQKGMWSTLVSRDTDRESGARDTRLVVGLDIALGGASPRCPGVGADIGTGGPRGEAAVQRLDQVFTRPTELPTRALARVDLTVQPYLLASLDKAGLGGAQVTATPDALIIRLPQPALSVASLSIGGAPVPNIGTDGQPVLWVEGSALHIGIRRLPNLSPGQTVAVDAVVVLSGGGLALVSFNVTGN